MEPKFEQQVLIKKEILYEPKILPTKDIGQVFEYGEDEYKPDENDVIHITKKEGSISSYTKFTLIKNISGLNYFFRFNLDANGYGGLSFKTLEYEYSRTNLDEDGKEELFQIIADFLESINITLKIKSIEISPSDASYKVKDAEDCLQEILRNNSESNESDLRKSYTGFRIFRLYEDIFKKEFVSEGGGGENSSSGKSFARARYFKTNFKKYLKNWKIVESDWSRISFSLVRND